MILKNTGAGAQTVAGACADTEKPGQNIKVPKRAKIKKTGCPNGHFCCPNGHFIEKGQKVPKWVATGSFVIFINMTINV